MRNGGRRCWTSRWRRVKRESTCRRLLRIEARAWREDRNIADRPPRLAHTRVSTRATDTRLAFHLRLAQEASFAAFARRVGDDHIWPGWFALLMIIHENPAINQTVLSRTVGRDKSTLTTSLRELVRKGLVHRERSADDRRQYTLRLTPLGEARLEEMSVHAQVHDRALDAIVGRRNKAALIDILKRITSDIGLG